MWTLDLAFLSEAPQFLLVWLLTFLVHSTLIIGGVWLAIRAGFVRNTAFKDLLWKVATVGAVVTATLQTGLDLDPLAGRLALQPGTEAVAAAAPASSPFQNVQPRALRGVSTMAPSMASLAPAVATPRLAAAKPLPPVRTAPASASPAVSASAAVPWIEGALVLWAVGATLGVLLLLLAKASLADRLAGRREITRGPAYNLFAGLCSAAGLDRPVRLTACHRLSGPIAFGDSEVCVPDRALEQLPSDELETMLAHELAHLVRRDPQWLEVSLCLERIFFFQPMQRLARRGQQEAAELLCDEWAVERTGGSVTLARCIARVATWIEASRPPLPVPGMASTQGSPLLQRVERLLDPASPRTRTPARGWTIAVTVAVLAGVLLAAPGVSADGGKKKKGYSIFVHKGDGEAADNGKIVVEDKGRTIKLPEHLTVTMSGDSTIAIEDDGHTIKVPEGSKTLIGGKAVEKDEVELGKDETLCVEDADGKDLLSLKRFDEGGFTFATGEGCAAAVAECDDEDDEDDDDHVTHFKMLGNGHGSGKPQVWVLPHKKGESMGGERAFLGVVSLEPGDALCAQLGLDRAKVSVLSEIVDDSAAAKAGLKQYDILTSIDGSDSASPSEVIEAMGRHKPGDEVTLKLIRAGKPEEAKVTLGAKKDDEMSFFTLPKMNWKDGEGMAYIFGDGPDKKEIQRNVEEAMKDSQEAIRRAHEAYAESMAKWDQDREGNSEKLAAEMDKMREKLDSELERNTEALDRLQEELDRKREALDEKAEQMAERAEELAERQEESGQRVMDEAYTREAFARMQKELESAGLGLDGDKKAALEDALREACESFCEDAVYDSINSNDDGKKATWQFKGGRGAMGPDLRSEVTEEIEDANIELDRDATEKVRAAAERVGESLRDFSIETESPRDDDGHDGGDV